jgi:hypothetical protein
MFSYSRQQDKQFHVPGGEMHGFRSYVIDQNDYIVWNGGTQAANLEAAIVAGFEALDKHNVRSQPLLRVEVWSGTQQLFAGTPLSVCLHGDKR